MVENGFVFNNVLVMVLGQIGILPGIRSVECIGADPDKGNVVGPRTGDGIFPSLGRDKVPPVINADEVCRFEERALVDAVRVFGKLVVVA